MMSNVIFYDILRYENIQEKNGSVKPQCQHIDQADEDLGVDENTPAITASFVSLELLLLVNH